MSSSIHNFLQGINRKINKKGLTINDMASPYSYLRLSLLKLQVGIDLVSVGEYVVPS